MQMEFERRITLMNPDFEIKEKLTSDTIFSFLNAYCERYVRNNYLQEDTVADDSRAQKKNVDALKGLVVRGLYDIAPKDEFNTDRTSDRVELPSDYFLYIRSNSLLSKHYKLEKEIDAMVDAPTTPTTPTTPATTAEGGETEGGESNDQPTNKVEDLSLYVVAPNKMIREDDTDKVISSYYNQAIILTPYIVFGNGNVADEDDKLYANIIHDEYTIVKKLDLVYYRKPNNSHSRKQGFRFFVR